MEQRVLVVGAGMAGLNLALALGARRGCRVVVLERDGPVADGPAAGAFSAWRRRGVSHFRQSHIFHPRLLALYRARHPDLLAALLQAGVRELTIEEALPAGLRPHYRPAADDARCTLLLARRATLEAVLRRHVASLPGVEIVPGSHVCGVVLERAADPPRATGVRIDRSGVPLEVPGDVIVDASGRFTRVPRWLHDQGIEARQEADVAVDTVYYTRYYRLHDHSAEPADFGRPVFGRRGYLSCCVYPADDRHFSVTLTCGEGDAGLRREFADPARFHRACTLLAEVAPWVEPGRAEPATGVQAMAGFRNYWRSYVAGGRPVLAGFFAIGDALAHTNPAYGAGCAWAAEHAHMLADVLAATADPTERALRFDQRMRAEAYPFYARMVARDRPGDLEPKAAAGLSPVRLRRRLAMRASALAEAARAGDIGIFLWGMRHKYMIRPPRVWSDRWFLCRRLVVFGLKGGWGMPGGWRRRARSPQRPMSRAEFLGALGGRGPRAER